MNKSDDVCRTPEEIYCFKVRELAKLRQEAAERWEQIRAEIDEINRERDDKYDGAEAVLRRHAKIRQAVEKSRNMACLLRQILRDAKEGKCRTQEAEKENARKDPEKVEEHGKNYTSEIIEEKCERAIQENIRRTEHVGNRTKNIQNLSEKNFKCKLVCICMQSKELKWQVVEDEGPLETFEKGKTEDKCTMTLGHQEQFGEKQAVIENIQKKACRTSNSFDMNHQEERSRTLKDHRAIRNRIELAKKLVLEEKRRKYEEEKAEKARRDEERRRKCEEILAKKQQIKAELCCTEKRRRQEREALRARQQQEAQDLRRQREKEHSREKIRTNAGEDETDDEGEKSEIELAQRLQIQAKRRTSECEKEKAERDSKERERRKRWEEMRERKMMEDKCGEQEEDEDITSEAEQERPRKRKCKKTREEIDRKEERFARALAHRLRLREQQRQRQKEKAEQQLGYEEMRVRRAHVEGHINQREEKSLAYKKQDPFSEGKRYEFEHETFLPIKLKLEERRKAREKENAMMRERFFKRCNELEKSARILQELTQKENCRKTKEDPGKMLRNCENCVPDKSRNSQDRKYQIAIELLEMLKRSNNLASKLEEGGLRENPNEEKSSSDCKLQKWCKSKGNSITCRKERLKTTKDKLVRSQEKAEILRNARDKFRKLEEDQKRLRCEIQKAVDDSSAQEHLMRLQHNKWNGNAQERLRSFRKSAGGTGQAQPFKHQESTKEDYGIQVDHETIDAKEPQELEWQPKDLDDIDSDIDIDELKRIDEKANKITLEEDVNIEQNEARPRIQDEKLLCEGEDTIIANEIIKKERNQTIKRKKYYNIKIKRLKMLFKPPTGTESVKKCKNFQEILQGRIRRAQAMAKNNKIFENHIKCLLQKEELRKLRRECEEKEQCVRMEQLMLFDQMMKVFGSVRTAQDDPT